MKQSTNYGSNLLNRFFFLVLTFNVVFSFPQASCAQTASNALGTLAAPNGTDLALGDSCYTIPILARLTGFRSNSKIAAFEKSTRALKTYV